VDLRRLSNGAFQYKHNISTNAINGLTVGVKIQGDGNNAGFYSSALSSLVEAKAISAVQTPDNTNGYAFAAKDAQAQIGTLSIATGFQSETGETAISSLMQTFASSSAPLSNGQLNIDLKVKTSPTFYPDHIQIY
jgi:hypothetical protein